MKANTNAQYCSKSKLKFITARETMPRTAESLYYERSLNNRPNENKTSRRRNEERNSKGWKMMSDMTQTSKPSDASTGQQLSEPPSATAPEMKSDPGISTNPTATGQGGRTDPSCSTASDYKPFPHQTNNSVNQ